MFVPKKSAEKKLNNHVFAHSMILLSYLEIYCSVSRARVSQSSDIKIEIANVYERELLEEKLATDDEKGRRSKNVF